MSQRTPIIGLSERLAAARNITGLFWRRAAWYAGRLTAEPQQRWHVENIPDVFVGFDTRIGSAELLDACNRLGVSPIGNTQRGYSRRSVGSKVEDAAGFRSWVKVSAVYGNEGDHLRDGELAAATIQNVPKPAILQTADWISEGRRLRAIQCTLAPGRTEPTAWAGRLSQSVTDAWIESLVAALANLRKAATPRWRIQPAEVTANIKSQFGDDVPHATDQWCPAHGDLQWSNLAVPELTMLDWECWGLAPQGFDEACLIAFSCNNRRLVRRLEDAFADQLQTRGGYIARLAALAGVQGAIKLGWLDPFYKEYLDEMVRGALRLPHRKS